MIDETNMREYNKHARCVVVRVSDDVLLKV